MTTPPPGPPPNPAAIAPPSFAGYAGDPGALEGVGFWPRVGARVLDLVLHYFVSICAGFVMGVVLAVVASLTGRPLPLLLAKIQNIGIAGFGLALLGSVAYHTICESMHGSTLGKLALSMVVVREDGSPCGLDSALLRSFAYFVDALFFGLVGYSAMQKSSRRQRYGDQWAHTIVCKRSQVRPENLRGSNRFVLALFLGMAGDAALVIAGWMIAAFAL
jgi:uncharacterized RDD family membrane protein YckC